MVPRLPWEGVTPTADPMYLSMIPSGAGVLMTGFDINSRTHVPAPSVPRRMLVVDDEEAILFAMDEYFTNRGYQVHCARELEEAQALLTYHKYDVVIADLRLTGINGAEGLELLSFVRDCSPKTKILLLTAYGSPMVEAEARHRGVHAFLSKPKPLAEIAQMVLGFEEAGR
jgi:DNA-binding NtrC family response regulator